MTARRAPEAPVRFQELPLTGAFLIEPERKADERGFFARTWCRREFEAHGIRVDWVQCNVSFNKRRGTLRGLHYQLPPGVSPNWSAARSGRSTTSWSISAPARRTT